MGADVRDREANAGKAGTGAELVRVTVTMTRGQHRALKRMATSKGETVSRLIREWVMEEGRGSDA